MKLECLHLTAYGRFAEAELGPLSPGLNIIEGPNEAGKSTTVEFVRSLLFGFQTGQGARRYEPLQGGLHGGWALATDRMGRRLRIERRPGPRPGAATVSVEGSAEVLTLETLLRGADRRLYTSVFAFSLDELRSLEILQADAVQGRIYAAGSGTGGHSLLDAVRSVHREADSIYRPGASTREINRLLKQRTELKARVEELKTGLDEYNAAQDRLAALRSELEAHSREEEAARLSVRQAELVRSAWPTWVELAAGRQRRREIPEIESFPEDGVRRLEALQQEMRTQEEVAQDLRDEHSRVEELLQSCTVDERLLDRRQELRSLVDRLAGYEALLQELPVRAARRDRYAEAGQAALQKLGPDWTPDRLAALDLSLAHEEEIRDHGRRISSAEQEVRDARERVLVAEAAVRRLEGLLARAEEAVSAEFSAPPAPVEQFAERLRLLEGARERREQIALGEQQLDAATETERNLEERQAQVTADVPGNAKITGVWALLALPAAGLVLWTLRDRIGLAIGLAAVLLIAGVAWWMLAGTVTRREEQERGRRAREVEALKAALETHRRKRTELQARLGEHQRALGEVEQRLGVALVDREAIRREAARLQELRDRRSRWESLTGVSQARREERDAANEELAALRKGIETANGRAEEIRAAWTTWLSMRRLPSTASTETALRLFAEAAAARASYRDRDEAERRMTELSESAEAFRGSVTALCAALDRPRPANGEIAATVRAIQDELDRSAALLIERSALDERLRGLERERQRSERRSAEAREELDQLLAAGDCPGDPEGFRHRSGEHAAREAADEEIRALERSLETLTAPGEARLRLEEALGELDHDALEAGFATARERLERSTLQLQDAAREEGRLGERLKALERQEELTAALRELRTVESELAEAAERWAILKITGKLLERTRERFETQRQPGVIRRASELIGRLTAGRYRSVVAPQGLAEVELEEPDGSRKGLAAWSRGTAEQLYLALRFAFIEDYARSPDVEPLPVIMDDVLVHADGYRRLHLAAETIGVVAEQHQVLYFTCRPADAAILAAAHPEARRFLIEDGRFVRVG